MQIDLIGLIIAGLIAFGACCAGVFILLAHAESQRHKQEIQERRKQMAQDRAIRSGTFVITMPPYTEVQSEEKTPAQKLARVYDLRGVAPHDD